MSLSELEALPAKVEAFIAATEARLTKLEADYPKAVATLDEVAAGLKLLTPLVPQLAALGPFIDEADAMVHHYAKTNGLPLSPHADVTPATPNESCPAKAV